MANIAMTKLNTATKVINVALLELEVGEIAVASIAMTNFDTATKDINVTLLVFEVTD